MNRTVAHCLAALTLGLAWHACVSPAAFASTLTGNPSADGWYFHGNSLDNGTYVRSNTQPIDHGFDIYTTQFTVTNPSAFDISSHTAASYDDYYRADNGSPWDQSSARAWEVGHTVIGVGGAFQTLTAAEAGWDEFLSTTVNPSNLADEHRFRLIAKIGTEDASWTTSSVAPGSGNGNGSTASGGVGTLFLTTSGWRDLGVWEDFAGTVLGVRSAGHISANGVSFNPGPDTARLIWSWDGDANRAGSWELLVNMSLVEADFAANGFTGPLPGQLGNSVIASVQVANNQYTDGLVNIAVPEPGTSALALVGLATISCAAYLRRRRG